MSRGNNNLQALHEEEHAWYSQPQIWGAHRDVEVGQDMLKYFTDGSRLRSDVKSRRIEPSPEAKVSK